VQSMVLPESLDIRASEPKPGAQSDIGGPTVAAAAAAASHQVESPNPSCHGNILL
jgi:hypothetical protein